MLHTVAGWHSGDWLAFFAAVTVVVTGAFALLTLLANKAFDLWGVVQLRRQQQDMADHQRTLAQGLNGGLSKRIGDAAAAAAIAAAGGADAATVATVATTAAQASVDPAVLAIGHQSDGRPARTNQAQRGTS